MDRRPTVTDADIATWLSVPTGEPPFDILTRAVARTRRTQQRPKIVARLSGTSSGERREVLQPPSRRIGYVLLATALVATMVGIAVGSGRSDQVLPSIAPSQLPPSAAPTNEPTATPAPPEIPRGTVIRSIPVDRLGLYLPVPDDVTPFFAGHVQAQVGRWVISKGDRGNAAGIEGGLGRPDLSVYGTDVATVIAKISALPDIRVEDIGPVTVDSEEGRLVWLHGLPIGVSVEQIRPLAIVEHVGRLYLVRPELSTGKSASAVSDLTDFVQRFDFIDPATYRGDRFTVTTPDSWQVVTKGSITTVHQGDGALYGVDFRIASYPLGARIEIARGEGVDPVTISGHDLEELRASIEAAIPGAAEGRWPQLVDGLKAYRFNVEQAATHEPLAALAVIVVGNRVVVITHTLLLEGPRASESFIGLLGGLTLER